MNNTLDQETDYGTRPGLDLGIEADRKTPQIMERIMDLSLDWILELKQIGTHP